MSKFDRDKWDAKYQSNPNAWMTPSTVVTDLTAFLPSSGKALDVAGGVGRHAIWLCKQGLEVTIADVSPIGLSVAVEQATASNVQLNTIESDLETEPFPMGPWDLVFSHHFLWRPLFKVFPSVLSEGGRLIVIQPTVTNLQRHTRPPKPFLLDDGELPMLASELSIIHYQEGWLQEGRHEAVLVAERNPARL